MAKKQDQFKNNYYLKVSEQQKLHEEIISFLIKPTSAEEIAIKFNKTVKSIKSELNYLEDCGRLNTVHDKKTNKKLYIRRLDLKNL